MERFIKDVESKAKNRKFEMISVKKLTDKKIIESHFRKNINLNLYQIGDLDEFFWKYTEWFGLYVGTELKQIILIYKGTDLPVMIALCDTSENSISEMKTLISEIKKDLPDNFYSHLSKGVSEVLEYNYEPGHHGTYLKMTLKKENLITFAEDRNIKRLNVTDIEIVKEFYYKSYPDNWFDKRMLETGKYFGYFFDNKIAGISGIHVYSHLYKVAVLGNITTDPEFRGQSICKKVTSELCKDLFETVDVIGLNVHSENSAAIKSYKNIGFEITDEYEEIMFEKSLNS